MKAAKRWYEKRCTENPTSKQWRKVMYHLYLKARTALQFESYTCEQGNREKKVRAGGSTQHWSPSEPRKTYESVCRQSLLTARCPVLHTPSACTLKPLTIAQIVAMNGHVEYAVQQSIQRTTLTRTDWLVQPSEMEL